MTKLTEQNTAMTAGNEKEKIFALLREYCEKADDIVMAFVFGSWANDRMGVESDMDIAVFINTLKIRCREQRETDDADSPLEKRIWRDLEKIAGREVDMVVLNRAPATIAASALGGVPLVIKDRNCYMDFLLRTTSEAGDYREWVEGYWMLKEKRRHEALAGR